MGKGRRVGEGRWIILRTSGRCTLALAASLTSAGYEVWTPTLILKSEARRETPAPITPTFVFARAGRMVDLIELSVSPLRGHDEFSVFHYFNRIPLIEDCELEALRTAENKAAPKRNRRPYSQGERVRVPDGPFAGMSGVVERVEGQFATIGFGGSMRCKIAAWHLRPGDIGARQPNFADAD